MLGARYNIRSIHDAGACTSAGAKWRASRGAHQPGADRAVGARAVAALSVAAGLYCRRAVALAQRNGGVCQPSVPACQDQIRWGVA